MISNYMSEEYAKRKNAQSALQRISCTISPPGRLLDIGCFCGVFLDVAGQAGWTCQGVEPLLGPSIYARSHYGLNVVTNTLSEDTFEQGSFDVITSFQVFEHLVDPVRELRIINSLLKPGGIVVIEVPNLSVFAAKLFRGYHRHFVKDHLNFFNRRTLEKALEDSGFLPVDLWYPSRLMTAEHLLGWLRRLTGNAGSASHDENLSREPRASGFIKLNFRDIIAVVARKNIDA
ncbi:MAG: class I SAM-dependent methyltransferase [Armatimonadota bacterium]